MAAPELRKLAVADEQIAASKAPAPRSAKRKPKLHLTLGTRKETLSRKTCAPFCMSHKRLVRSAMFPFLQYGA